jgi:hypothetical protein
MMEMEQNNNNNTTTTTDAGGGASTSLFWISDLNHVAYYQQLQKLIDTLHMHVMPTVLVLI